MYLTVNAFGKLRLEHDGYVVSAFPTRQVEELFAFLLVNPQTEHSREKIINLLWPELPASSGRGRLSTVLWRLRTLFQQLAIPVEDYLQATRDWIAFVPTQPLNLDLLLFRSHLAAAATATSDTELERALERAIDIYRGDLFEGLYADWCLNEREYLARQHLRAMGQLMACLMRQKRHDEALALGTEILHRDPLREEVHRAMMHCYWQNGQFAQAARQFQDCTQLLLREMQISPMPETVILYSTIMEDRLNYARLQSSMPTAVQRQLQLAFAEFQQVVIRFNRMLDQLGEVSLETTQHEKSL